MKKLLFLGIVALFAVACQQNTPPADEKEEGKEEKTVDKTPKRIEVKGVKGEELAKKFDMDFEKNSPYDGYYEAYMDGDKEVLHGKFEFKGTEDQSAYMERKIKEDKKNEKLEPIALLAEWTLCSYTGQMKEGKKDGLWTEECQAYEAAGKATISFDAASEGCGEATYEGGAESYCFSFKGKIPNCNFREISKHTKEKECN